MFLLYAAIMSIEPLQFQAAKLDGASRWQEFWHLTLPGILPVIAVTAAFVRRCLHQGIRHHPRHDRRRTRAGDDGVPALHLAHRLHQPPLRPGFGPRRHRHHHFRHHRHSLLAINRRGTADGGGILRRNPNGTVAVLLLNYAGDVAAHPVWRSGLKPDAEINRIPPTFLPHAFSLANFTHSSRSSIRPANAEFGHCLGLGVILSLVARGSAPTGSRLSFPGSGPSLADSGDAQWSRPRSLVLPLYIMMESFHLSNTLSVTVGITVLNCRSSSGC